VELGDGAIDAWGKTEVVCVDDEAGRHGEGDVRRNRCCALALL
jgi:hypothetical protein